MTNMHLTEETLQAFLLKETQDDAAAMHLSACAACREKYENYQHLVATIQNVAPEAFAFDVTAVVMDRIVQYEKRESRTQEFVFWGLLTFLVIVILSFSIPFIPGITTVFYSTPLFTTLLITGTGLAVLLFLLADISKQYKMKAEKIFQNKLQPTL